MNLNDINDASMFDLFRQEAENQTALITQGLLGLERNPTDAALLESLMRAAHSLKGAARIVGVDAAVHVAHAMEDCFVAAQKGKIVLHSEAMDRLLRASDMLLRIANTDEQDQDVWALTGCGEIDDILKLLETIRNGQDLPASADGPAAVAGASAAPAAGALAEKATVAGPAPVSAAAAPGAPASAAAAAPATAASGRAADQVLRVGATNLNRLLGLAGESLVQSRWLRPYAESLLRVKRRQWQISKKLEEVRELLANQALDERVQTHLSEIQRQAAAGLQELADRHAELEEYVRRSTGLSHRLYREALATRMRPFADAAQGFPRLVRDLARQLGKEVRLEVSGQDTAVDRDILEKLEAPLTHLLRNSLDHGLELPAERESAGKAREGVVRIEARHSAGLLLIVVSDDGHGIDPVAVRDAIVRRNLSTREVVNAMSEEELLAFLFLPGFSLRETVTEISGRGVGLDVVQAMVKQVRGTVRMTTRLGQGIRVQLQLPLTLSVLRTLLAEIDGEAYAFPLARIGHTVQVPRSEIEILEGREHIAYDHQRLGLVAARQVLGRGGSAMADVLNVVVVGERPRRYGLVVDRFLGEGELVVRPLDPRLGKIKDISAAALMPDGAPVLIIDVDDLLRSIELLVSGGRLGRVQAGESVAAAKRRKRVLVVDDSLTVRELERKLLGNRGYEVEVAVDGMDGWNAVRTQAYDLVVSDVDMPRMDGIELVSLIKKDARLKALPVMIVSYKDREEDRRRGLDAGADYYLTKGSFHDETLLNAVVDLIGEPEDSAPAARSRG